MSGMRRREFITLVGGAAAVAAGCTGTAARGQATSDCRAHCRLRGSIPPRSGKLPRRHTTARIFGRRKRPL